MRKIFKMENLECAHCAAKMEKGIKKLEGVNDVCINFMAQKLIIEADDDKFEEIIKEAIKICKKTEPDCRVIV